MTIKTTKDEWSCRSCGMDATGVQCDECGAYEGETDVDRIIRQAQEEQAVAWRHGWNTADEWWRAVLGEQADQIILAGGLPGGHVPEIPHNPYE